MTDIQGDVSAGNNIVLSNDLGESTKWIDISSSISALTNLNIDSVDFAEAIFYSDSVGNWFMDAQISLILDTTAGTSYTQLTISDVTFKNAANQNVDINYNNSTIRATGDLIGRALLNSSTIRADWPSNVAAQSDFEATIGIHNVKLDSEPTTYTTAANMESTAVKNSIAVADDTDAGLLSYYKEDTFTPFPNRGSSSPTYSPEGTYAGNYTRIGNVITANFNITMGTTSGAGSGVLTISGFPDPGATVSVLASFSVQTAVTANAMSGLMLSIGGEGVLYLYDTTGSQISVAWNGSGTQILGAVSYLV